MDNRVKLLRKEMNLSQEAFGTRLGVTGAGISRIESGKRNLTEQMVILICKEYNINENWLRYGKGDIFKKKLSSGMEQLAQCYQLDELDIRIINEYAALDDKKRKVIKEYIMRIAYSNLNSEKKDKFDNNMYSDINTNSDINSNSDSIPNSDIISDGAIKNEVLRCAEGPDTGGKL